MSPVSRALSHETPPCGSRRTALAEIRKSSPCKANCYKTPCDQRFLTKALIARINPASAWMRSSWRRKGENLGSNPAGVPDILAISWTSHDYVNHLFGPESRQSQDQTIR